MAPQTVGERVKILREATGLNPRQFALSVDLNTSNYYKVESGKLGVKTNALKVIADKYNARFSWLLTGEGEMLTSESVIKEPNANYNHNKPDESMAQEKPQPRQEPTGIDYFILLQQATTAAIDAINRVADNSIKAIQQSSAENTKAIQQTSADNRAASKEMLQEFRQAILQQSVLADQQAILNEARRKSEANYTTLVGVRQFLIDELATLQGRKPDDVARSLNNKVAELAVSLGKGKSDEHSQRKKVVSS